MKHAPKLPRGAEQLLSSWPIPHRSDDQWDLQAQHIMARIAEAPLCDASLLAPPLPVEAGEGDAPETSLRALAQAALSADSVEREGDAEQSVRVVRIVVEEVTQAPKMAEADETSTDVASTPELSRLSPTSAPPRGSPRQTLPWAVAALAAAAALMLLLRSNPVPPHTPPPGRTTSQGKTSVNPAPRAPGVVPPVSSLSSRAAEVKKQPEPEQESTTARRPEMKAKAKPRAGGMEPSLAPNTVPKPREIELTPAEATERPMEPSQGAVAAAIGSVMGGARACLAGQDAPSRAHLTFGSDGKVRSVAITGPAAGSSGERCLRTALSQARVEPFASPSFDVGFSVRP